MKYSLQFKDIHVPGYERVIEVTCNSIQLHAIIAIHQTIMGPALGGIRAFAYPSFDMAMTDVLRLSKSMTYKATLSETGTGGGKSVIILPKGITKPTEDMLYAFGQAINTLEGQYIAAEDLGIDLHAVATISKETPYICGLDTVSGDPSVYTAHGVFLCMKEAAYQLWGSSSLSGKRIAIQGIGAVGSKLMQTLFFEGANLYVSDIADSRLQRARQLYGVTAVPGDIVTMDCDILCPCAFGAVIDKNNQDALQCQAIVGAANNQLASPDIGRSLFEKRILYVPDYLANAGGLLNVASATQGHYNPVSVRGKTERLPKIFREMYAKGIKDNMDMVSLSDALVEERLLQKC